MSNKRTKGVVIFGSILIASSMLHMHTLLDFEHYKYLFYPLPEMLILFRYFISWSMRIIGLISGIGILCQKNTFRKIAIYLFIFTICTIYGKHPYHGFQNHAAYMDQLLKNSGAYPLKLWGVEMPSFSSLAIISAMCAQIFDVLFASVFIYYFTRPKVKAQFR